MSVFTSLRKLLTTRNVGALDRLLRAIPTPVVSYLVMKGHVSGPAAWLLSLVALMLLVTAVSGACSVYYLLGFSTCPISGGRKSDPRPPAPPLS